jgi:polysaccharide biosynthesis/export protein
MNAIQQINDRVGFRIRNGQLNLPDIGSLEVAGLTLEEAQQKIESAFRKQIRDVEVFLDYRDRLSRKVDLAGLVSVPYIPVNGRIRLYEVLAAAKVPAHANFFMSYVSRDNMPLAVDMHRLMHDGDMSQNIVMHGGDKIFIADPRDSRAMIMGEVGLPRPINVPYGFISLREALVEVGGIPFTGDRNCIQVIRGNLPCPKIYTLSWCHITHLPNDSLLLIPGDTVYVTEKPITQWNRFISQILPTVAIFKEFHGCYTLFND